MKRLIRTVWSAVRPRTVGRTVRYLQLATRFPQLRGRFVAIGRGVRDLDRPLRERVDGGRVRFLRFSTLHVHERAELCVGDGVSFSPGCTVCVHERVEIGAGSTFGEGVSITTRTMSMSPSTSRSAHEAS